jgi:hypothetical protein
MLKKILGLVAISFLFAWPVSAVTWNDCPFAETECTGECGAFIDTDNDGICDHSQPAPEDRVEGVTATPAATAYTFSTDAVDFNLDDSLVVSKEESVVATEDLISGTDLKTMTVAEIAVVYQIDAQGYATALGDYLNSKVKSTDAFQILKDNYGLEPSVAKDIAVSLQTGVPVEVEVSPAKALHIYDMVPIFGVLVFFYVLTHVLSKKNKITVATHRKIWNILLTLTFLASGLLGLLLVIRINFGISIPLPFNMLYWHVEAGIAMTAISIFHIIWHWPYYRGMVR